MAVDSAGNVHFVGTSKHRIVYWTNSSGAWEQETIGSPANGDLSDKSPEVAITDTGDIVVVYERSACFPLGCDLASINVTIKTSAGWSAPQEIATGVSPSLAVSDGVVGVAYQAIGFFTDVFCEEPSPLDYAVLSNGQWSTTRVAGDGVWPILALGPGAVPYVVFADECGSHGGAGLYLAKGDGDSFGLKPVPHTSPAENEAYALAVDEAGRVHLLYLRYDPDDFIQSVYAVRDESGWTEPVQPLPKGFMQWMSVSAFGVAHFLGEGDAGVWHAWGTGADLSAERILNESTDSYDGAVAVDASGRPHVLYATGGGGSVPFRLWYGVKSSP